MTDAAQLRALIEALESAPQGSLDFDGRIWCAVRGYAFVMWDGAGVVYRNPAGRITDIGHWPASRVPAHSTSLDAALPGEEIVALARSWERGSWRWAAIVMSNDRDFYEGAGHTEPLARRAAALRAMLHQMEKADG